MTPAMTPSEFVLFQAFVRQSKNYLEFGSGGSTFVAAGLVQHAVISVDSSIDWLDRVRAECEIQGMLRPSLFHVDIGPVGELGFPIDEAFRFQWPSYYQLIWTHVDPTTIDTYLVDGRFRVACFLKIIENANTRALILIHDFTKRHYYHIIYEFAEEIAKTDNLSVFVKKAQVNLERLQYLLDDYAFDAR
jgi:hypothetical protein